MVEFSGSEENMEKPDPGDEATTASAAAPSEAPPPCRECGDPSTFEFPYQDPDTGDDRTAHYCSWCAHDLGLPRG